MIYDWLRDEHLDRNRGPWQVMAVVLLTPTAIRADEGIPLPQLGGAAGDPSS